MMTIKIANGMMISLRWPNAGRWMALAAVLALPACTGDELTRNFGLTRDAPDEFTVTTRAPLSMPPDYQLRPPRPGASRPQEQSERQQAEATLAPESILAGPAPSTSPGQQALLTATGPRAPSDIRNKVDEEGQLDAPGPSFTDTLMFWRSPPVPGTAVDPARESQRLRQNAALGQSPEAGNTPIIQPKRESFIQSLF
jgi:hypothetical protein